MDVIYDFTFYLLLPYSNVTHFCMHLVHLENNLTMKDRREMAHRPPAL